MHVRVQTLTVVLHEVLRRVSGYRMPNKAARKRQTWASIPKGSKLWYPVWNKGKTKETDPRIAASAERMIGHPLAFTKKYPYRRGKKCIWMRSTWEVAYARFLDTLFIKWRYEPMAFYVGSGAWV